MALPINRLTRQEAINLIVLMNQLNQKEQAKETYRRTNEFHPDWNLFDGVKEAMKGEK